MISLGSIVSAKVFEDQFGRIINAELISHTGEEGENVTIKKSDKKSRRSECAPRSEAGWTNIKARGILDYSLSNRDVHALWAS